MGRLEMCVSQYLWMGCRGPFSPALPPILLLLCSFLLIMPPFAQGEISIPEHYILPNIKRPPNLTQVPTSFTAFSHEDMVLPCEATGNPTPSFRWEKDGKWFGPQTEGSGTLVAQKEEPLESYAGSYRCYASNTLGTAVTQTVTVIVEPQPLLVKQNRLDMTAYEGERIILNCNPPNSSTPPRIYWMDEKMFHIEQSDRVMIGLDGNLYFSNLLMSDTRTDYLCTAHYSAARTILPDTIARLTILASNDVTHGRKPHLFRPTGSHTSVQALRGQSLTLECIPAGLPTPKVEWQKINGNLKNLSPQLKNHNRWLHFDHITYDDDGEYRCRAFNSHGNATHSFTITVRSAPYWFKEPQDLMYTPGETARLECPAKGHPEPSVTWSINGLPLTEVDGDPRRIVTSSALILRDVAFADTAVYQCQATNRHGSILRNIKLFVAELPPQILSSDGVVYRVYDGGDVQMHCEVFGSPQPHIDWSGRDKEPLISDRRVSLLTNGTVELVNVTHEDGGQYSCSVQNSNISIAAYLQVFNQTTVLMGPQDINVLRGNAAFLHCRFYRDPRLHDYQVEWRKDGQKLPENESRVDKFTVFENYTLEVTDVQPDDTGSYSCEINVKQLGRVRAAGSITVVAPPDPPTSLSVSNIEDHSVTLKWTPGPSHNSPITEFIVDVQEEPQTAKGKKRWQKWKRVTGDFRHVQLTLNPFCIYRFRVIAVNDIGQSDPSDPTEDHHTPPAVPDRNPTGVRSNSSDPGTLIITWDEMEKRFHNGHDFNYKVCWREAEEKTTNWKCSYARSPPFLVNNTGTYTPFEIKVQAVNSIGDGPAPEAETGHSGEDKPEEAPRGVSSTVKNSTVIVTWNEAQRVRGQLLGYKIYIRRLGPQISRDRRSLGKHQHKEVDGPKDKNNWVVEVRGPETSKEVTGLRLFSQYQLRVTAFNSKGESPPSHPHHFSTPEGPPGPPRSLRFESPTETSVTLYWKPPLETNGKLLGYVVQYQQETYDTQLQIQMISDPDVNHIELDALDPNSYYIFNVIARTAAGDGPPITKRGATLLKGAPPSNITIVSSNTSFNLSWVPRERERNHVFQILYFKTSDGENWEESERVNSTQGFFSLTGLKPGTEYKLMVLHENITLWEDKKSTRGPEPSAMPGGFATQGWLIGLISAIVLLILILLILCLIKRSRGGKYAVKDKENKEACSDVRPMKDETYGDYSDGDEKRSDSQRSLCDDSKLGSDDSLAEYGDSVDIQFNEDGSFIGQYSGRGPVPHGNDSSGPTSPVNAIPPPPIAPSMSSILNRPS